MTPPPFAAAAVLPCRADTERAGVGCEARTFDAVLRLTGREILAAEIAHALAHDRARLPALYAAQRRATCAVLAMEVGE